MTKIRKLKRSKKYQYDVNRKRMNKKRLPNIESVTVLKAWNSQLSSQKNFKRMGLVFDLNKDIKHMNQGNGDKNTRLPKGKAKTTDVVQELEKDATAIPSGKNFRFSEEQKDFMMYLLDKYGDDYKAMSRDRRNYLQHTWKQLRYKINLFKNIPEHYKEYLKNKKQ